MVAFCWKIIHLWGKRCRIVSYFMLTCKAILKIRYEIFLRIKVVCVCVCVCVEGEGNCVS